MAYAGAVTLSVVVHRDGLDSYGDPIVGSSHSVAGCWVEPASSSESHTGFRSNVVTGIVLSMPYGADVTDGDQVVIPPSAGAYAGRWFVVGDPFPWLNPLTGTAFRTVAAIERAK